MKPKEKEEEIKAPETIEEPVVSEESDKIAESEESKKSGKAEKAVKDIPENVKSVLKIFSNLEKAYVDGKGGVFDTNTPKDIRKEAVLYKNPYYKP